MDSDDKLQVEGWLANGCAQQCFTSGIAMGNSQDNCRTIVMGNYGVMGKRQCIE